MDTKQLTQNDVIKIVQDYMKTSAFVDRKLTDIPTDPYQVVSRKYVTQNGASANRPATSVIGTQFFDLTLNKPIYVSSTLGWTDAAGNPV